MGTIGSAVCAALPARGDERVALSRDPEQAMARIWDSRVQGTRLPAAALRELTGDRRPAVLISVCDRLLRPQRQRDALGDR